MRVNIWIRKADEQVWQDIKDKPSFIAKAIKNERNKGNKVK